MSRKLTLIQAISETLQRIENLESRPDGDASGAHDELDNLQSLLPSGSGIDSGTTSRRLSTSS